MLEWWMYPLLALTGVVSGFVDAIAGGGGLITMPVLLSTGLPPHLALGTNKLQSSLGTVTSANTFNRRGMIDAAALKVTVLVVFILAALGTIIVQHVTVDLLQYIVPILLMGSAAYVILSPRMDDAERPSRLTEAGYRPVAGVIGFYDGFFGPGTGSFLITSQVALRGHGLLRATAHAKLLNATSNLASLLFFALGGKVIWLLGLTMAAGSALGGWLGSHSAMRFGAQLIRPLIVVISLALTARLALGWYFN